MNLSLTIQGYDLALILAAIVILYSIYSVFKFDGTLLMHEGSVSQPLYTSETTTTETPTDPDGNL